MVRGMLKSKQTGLATVEMAVVGSVFFLVLFTVIEVGRLMWTWETLTEATRRGARVAAVCPVNHASVPNVTVFADPVGGGPSVLPGLSANEHVDVDYLDVNGVVTTNWCAIRFVQVRINGYQHSLAIPFLQDILSVPEFETTLPRESLGKIPGRGFECFEVPSATPICT